MRMSVLGNAANCSTALASVTPQYVVVMTRSLWPSPLQKSRNWSSIILMPDILRNDTIMHIWSAEAMSRIISAQSGTPDCPPVNRLLTRKPDNGRTISFFVARSAASRCPLTTADSSSGTADSFSSSSISTDSRMLLVISILSSTGTSASSSFRRMASETKSANIFADSAVSILSVWHT